MKLIPLSGGKAKALVDDADFERLGKFKWSLETREHTSYATRKVTKGGKSIKFYLHREVLGLKHCGQQVDHINHDGLDNRRENLRACTARENSANTRRPRTKPYRGVYANPVSYRARIKHEGRTLGLGNYRNPEEAAKAYDRKARELFGAFAITNFTTEGQ